MDNLPSVLSLEILNRLNDSTDLARCRIASQTLNTLSQDVRSLNILCSWDRYLKSRAPETKALVTPFKTIVKNLITSLKNLEFVSVGVEKPNRGVPEDEMDDESDDLYLTEVNFVSEWLPALADRLKRLRLSDFWIQSCWRRSEVLSVVSSFCHSLLELEVKNAWLSVDGLKPMTTLTSLTLEFIRLDDEDLNTVNNCFPSLQVLNLIGVGGLQDPRIHLFHLKTCQWTVSNAPLSLNIYAPNLVELKLKCVRPHSLVLETPLVSVIHISIEKTGNVDVGRFSSLKSLQIESTDLCKMVSSFACGGNTVQKLMLDSTKCMEPFESNMKKFDFDALFDAFPSLVYLTLGPGAWSKLESCFSLEGFKGRSGMKGLKQIVAHLVISEVEVTKSFISSVLEECTNLSDMFLLIHQDVDLNVSGNLISRCMADCPRVRWKWGMWKEGTKDTWVSVSI